MGKPSLCGGCELGAAGAQEREDRGLQDLGASKHKKSFRTGKPFLSRRLGVGLRAAASISAVKLEFSLSNRVTPLLLFSSLSFSFLGSALFAQVRKGEGMGEVNH